MRIVTASDAPADRPATPPLRMDGITTGVRVLLRGGMVRFYPAATSFVYVGAWLLVEDDANTLAAVERGEVLIVETGRACEVVR